MGYYNNSAQTFLLVTIIIASFAVISSSGGLLSNHLLVKKSHYYLVQRITDIADKDINTSSVSSEDEQAYDKGTLTSAVSSSTAINTRTSYSDCGSVASIKSLTLNPCDKSKGKNGLSSDICEIKRGSNATFNLSFVPKSNATQLRSVIHGIVDFVPIPFPCPQVCPLVHIISISTLRALCAIPTYKRLWTVLMAWSSYES